MRFWQFAHFLWQDLVSQLFLLGLRVVMSLMTD